MTDTAWHGVTPIGTTTAGELISALKRVAPARSRHERSALSGTMLYAAGGVLTAWGTDSAMLAVTQTALDRPGGGTTTAVVPSGWLAALRARFDRPETVELGVRGGALLVRRPGDDESLLQPLWPADAQLEAYRELFANDQAAGVVSVRGNELLTKLRRTSGTAAVTLAVETHQVTVLSGSETAGAVPITSTLEPQRIVLDRDRLADAVAAVINLKLPNVVFEPHDDGRLLRLYGASSSDPTTFGNLDCFIRSGSSSGRVAERETGEEPGEATIEKTNGALPIDQVLAELDGIIGQPALKEQVRSLRTMVEINRKRAEQGLKTSQVGSHMVFAGPPGTGKTTVARLIARLLHALGVLEREDVKEVARPDLVSQNIGGTEEKTKATIDDAMGGVLFIDEAYSLAQGGDTDFGKQAIDALLKEVEDRRDSFVCILAGYGDQMKDFMASNPGLTSRFPRTINFVAYEPGELVQIAKSMAKGMDNDISEDGVTELTRRLTDEQRRGGFERKDWGNARSVRNIIEQAATNRDVRISLSGEHSLESLITIVAEDIAAACDVFRIGRAQSGSESVDDVLAELDAQVGQPQLKQQVRAIVAQARVARAKQEQGLASGGMALEHLLFTGPPGTGKTTVARLLARLYRALGVLPNDGIVEVNQSILVAGYKGQTAIQTREKIDEALGGVLFVDEAYTLVSGGDSSFGQEAVDELLPRLENDRGKFVAIAAGYPDEMARFVASNVGLQSRFTTTIEFVPYTADELVEITLSMAKGNAETLTEGAVTVLRKRLSAVERGGGFADRAWGNARAVRNLLDRAIQLRDVRISEGDLSADPSSLVTVTEADIVAACDREGLLAGTARESADDVLAELDEQIGQSAVKEQVRSLIAQARLARERTDAGLGGDGVALEHLLFVGPPGTGKTTVARLIGRLYGALGLLPKGHLVQVDRTGLVGQYVGQTAPRTNAKVDDAMGGVLFIDEAYALVPSSPQDFGGEAIDALLPRLTDDKNRFIAIAAGYPDDMRRFVAANVGLRSRFTTTIEFEPYDSDELVEIAGLMARKRGQRFGESALEALRARLGAAGASGRFSDAEWGNAREMSNLVDDAMKRRDLRLHADGYSDPDEMITLASADVVGGCEKVLGG